VCALLRRLLANATRVFTRMCARCFENERSESCNEGAATKHGRSRGVRAAPQTLGYESEDRAPSDLATDYWLLTTALCYNPNITFSLGGELLTAPAACVKIAQGASMFASNPKTFLLLSAMALTACGSICGDGVIDQENNAGDQEICDDANRTPGDGCSANCTELEPGFDCQTPGELCIKLQEDCADGVDNDEDELIDCDDIGCTNDPNCAGECGNGVVEINEECDDANLAPGDGCDASCLVEVESASSFAAAQAINQEQPDLATFSIFGDAIVDTDGDGEGDSRSILVISTSNPELCGDITNTSLGNFINSLFGGAIDGETVTTFALVSDSLDPIAVAQTTITGDGQALSVDAGFVVAADGAAIVDTTFGSNFDGVFTVDTVDGVFITGTYTGAVQTEFVNGVENLNIGFTGSFTATHCPAISDTMQGLIDVLFG
jgi:cysteine-rich repeat protein